MALVIDNVPEVLNFSMYIKEEQHSFCNFWSLFVASHFCWLGICYLLFFVSWCNWILVRFLRYCWSIFPCLTPVSCWSPPYLKSLLLLSPRFLFLHRFKNLSKKGSSLCYLCPVHFYLVVIYPVTETQFYLKVGKIIPKYL